MQFLKNLTPREKSVAKKAVQRNAYFAHPDQLLVAMCADEEDAVRKKAVTMIQKIRVENETEPASSSDDESDEDCEVDPDLIDLAEDEEIGIDADEQDSSSLVEEMGMHVREVRVPKLKFACKSYHTMIHWKQANLRDPPFIAFLSDEEIASILTQSSTSW